jgi:NAD(P)-dependent dehydrogenase (short-subunit alcohol dehydrogenase family)
MARRGDRLADAQKEAGDASIAISCDVTDPASCATAIASAVDHLSGIDALLYTPAISPLVRLADTDIDTWRRVFDTNVIGAAIVTAAALPHLKESGGQVVFLSSVIASGGPPWPGLGAYAVSKAALDKLVEAWRAEHPELGFTRLVVGECAGGAGDATTQLANDWDADLAAEMLTLWIQRNYMSGELIDVNDLVDAVHGLLQAGATVSQSSVVLAPRPRRAR